MRHDLIDRDIIRCVYVVLIVMGCCRKYARKEVRTYALQIVLDFFFWLVLDIKAQIPSNA